MDFDTRPRRGYWEPNADVVWDETHGVLVIKVEVAGCDPASLRVSIEGRRLFIEGRRCDSPQARSATYLQKEVASGDFFKELHVPAALSDDGASATYAEGMLNISLPLADVEYVPASRTQVHLIIKRILV